jgi:hypothetical protein
MPITHEHETTHDGDCSARWDVYTKDKGVVFGESGGRSDGIAWLGGRIHLAQNVLRKCLGDSAESISHSSNRR